MRRALSGFLPVSLFFVLVVSPQPAAAQTIAATSSSGSTESFWKASDDAVFRNLFAQTLDDFARLPTVNSAVILSIGGAAAAAVHPADQRLSTAMSGSGVRTTFGSGKVIGGAAVQTGAALATYTLGRIFGDSSFTRVGGELMRAQILTQTMTVAVKAAVGRTRPDGTQYSFPSGHSAASFATATVLQRNFGWKVGIPAYAMASYVAASRIQAQRHFLSDVTFGAAVGIVAGRTVTVGSGSHRFALAPAAVPGGGGVSFTLVGRD